MRVGERVKIVANGQYLPTGLNAHDMGRITEVDDNDHLPYEVEFDSGKVVWMKESEIEVVEVVDAKY